MRESQNPRPGYHFSPETRVSVSSLRDISHHLPFGQSQLKIYECSSALPPVRDGDPELLGESHEDQ